MTGRMLRATAIGTVAVLVVAGPRRRSPQSTPAMPAATTITVNNGAAEQIDPHVDGDLVAYTDHSQGRPRFTTTTSSPASIIPSRGVRAPATRSPDVSGNRIAMARQTGLSRQVVVYDTAVGTSVEIDPPIESGAFATAIAGTTVAFVDASRRKRRHPGRRRERPDGSADEPVVFARLRCQSEHRPRRKHRGLGNLRHYVHELRCPPRRALGGRVGAGPVGRREHQQRVEPGRR